MYVVKAAETYVRRKIHTFNVDKIDGYCKWGTFIASLWSFLTAACCPRRDFFLHTHTPLPPLKMQQTFVLHTQKNHVICTAYSKKRHLYCVLKKALKQTFVLHTQKSTSFVLRTQKSTQKVDKKRRKKGGKKGSKQVGKKYTKKAHCHFHNTHANHQKKTS